MTELTSLRDYLRRYCLSRDITPGAEDQLLVAVNLLERFARHRVAIEQLNDELLNEFIRWLQSLGRSQDTLRTRRGSVLCLWRAAADDGLCEPPKRIRPVRRNDRVVRAYSREDMQCLLVTIRNLRGKFRTTGIHRSLWMESFVLASWDTALRLSDMLRIKQDWIDSSGCINVVQNKTRRMHRVSLSRQTLEAISRTLADGESRELIWPLWARREQLYDLFRSIVKQAGLPSGSSIRWIRRGSASAIEAMAPGTAWRHLGHARPGLDRQSYIDPSIADPPPKSPPPIFPLDDH